MYPLIKLGNSISLLFKDYSKCSKIIGKIQSNIDKDFICYDVNKIQNLNNKINSCYLVININCKDEGLIDSIRMIGLKIIDYEDITTIKKKIKYFDRLKKWRYQYDYSNN
jgi:hypothetical protein